MPSLDSRTICRTGGGPVCGDLTGPATREERKVAMSDFQSILRWRGAIATLLAALAVLLAVTAVSASASARAASPPTFCVRLPSTGLLPPGQTASTQLE